MKELTDKDIMKPQQLTGQPLELKKPPAVKVLLVKQTVDELEKLLAEKWKIASCFPHQMGALFLLMKD